MTRVLLLGNFRHPWCSEVHFGRSYEALGCTVLRLQEDEQTPGSVEREASDFGADLVHYTRTWGLPPTLTDVWRRLETRGVKTVSVHLDLYVGLVREATLDGNSFWSTGYVFTPDGDPAAAARFAELGINHYWSPPAVVHDECVPGDFRPELAHDVVFVGSANYHPEHPFRPQLLHWLRRTYQANYGQYGHHGGRVIRDRLLNDLYASVKCAVGDSLLLPGRCCYFSDRLTETLGRGGVLVFPEVPGLRDYMGLVDGEHCLFFEFGDFDGLASRIEWCLTNPAEARAMADRGQAHIRAHHTYAHRLARVLHTVGLRDSPDPPPLEVVTFANR